MSEMARIKVRNDSIHLESSLPGFEEASRALNGVQHLDVLKDAKNNQVE